MSISPRKISRVVNLAFKVTGLKQQHEEVQKLLQMISVAVRTLAALKMGWASFQVIKAASGDPTAWFGFILSILMLGSTAMDFSPKEEGKATNPRD